MARPAIIEQVDAWKVPARFNFARDVVEPRTGPALTFLSAAGDGATSASTR